MQVGYIILMHNAEGIPALFFLGTVQNKELKIVCQVVYDWIISVIYMGSIGGAGLSYPMCKIWLFENENSS